jgi:hypothetical protein
MSQFLDLTKLKKSIHVTKPQLKHELKPQTKSQSQKEDIINLKTLKKINLPQVNLNKVNLTKLNPTKVDLAKQNIPNLDFLDLKQKKKIKLELKSFYDGTEHFLINWESGRLFTDEPDIKHIGTVKIINGSININYLN